MDRPPGESSIPERPISHSSQTPAVSQRCETSFLDIEQARQSLPSVDDGGSTRAEPVGAETPRPSSIGHQTQRQLGRNSVRKSLLSRKHRLPSTEQATNPSSPRMSRSSSIAITRAESPYQGATGPSHPYGMYSQDTNMSRVPSSATASTMQRPERTYSGPRGPAQPYAMFAQNTTSIDEPDSFDGQPEQTPITYPAGSRSAPQPQHRRLGPDGEDLDDLIGPYGYAEQLPPYTRYPNDIPPKRDLDATSFINGSGPEQSSNEQQPHNTVSAPQPDQPPHSPVITHQATYRPLSINNPPNITIDPYRAAQEHVERNSQPVNSPALNTEPVVMTPRSNPFSDTSTQGSTTVVDSNTSSEKGNLKQRARELPKRRICWNVIPCWLLALLVAICVGILIGGILGGVLAHDQGVKTGTYKALQSSEPHASDSYVLSSIAPAMLIAYSSPVTTVTSIIPAQTPDDAIPIGAQSGPPPALPTGSFSVTLDEPWVMTNSCLTDPNQNNAWDCSNGASLNITIAMQDNQPYVTLTYRPKPGTIQYGAQPPQLSTGPSSLLYMRDNSKSAFKRGPAYVFRQPFDKTVIVRSQDFPGAITKRSTSWSIKRWLGLQMEGLTVSGPTLFRRVQQSDWNMTNYAAPNEKPWLCSWRGTQLSGYIYVTENVNQQAQYPKSMKLSEKRPIVNPTQPFCQQMVVGPDFSLTPLKQADGSVNLVNLQEEEVNGNDEPDDKPNGNRAQRRHQLFRREIPVGGPRCECAWQST